MVFLSREKYGFFCRDNVLQENINKENTMETFSE